jgi:death-on-curing protein
MAQSDEPVWIELELALAIHDRQLAEHGGPIGVRDSSALDSALARARNDWTCGEKDLCRLAAAYSYGIARNHPFNDGNKRTAWILARLFLSLNHIRVAFRPEEAIEMVLALASGTHNEADIAKWFSDRLA